jgi:hypothetical protein
VLIFAIFVSSQVESTSAACTFIPDQLFPAFYYVCEFSGAQTTSENDVLDFSGNHVGSRTDADVTHVRFVNSQLAAIPSNVFDVFPNLQIFEAVFVGLNRLNVGTFRNCASLQELRLNENLITRLENGVFKGCQNLVTINLNHNLISLIDANVFVDTQRLSTIRLDGNQLVELPESVFSNSLSLRDIILSNNRLERIFPTQFRGDQYIFGIDLRNNRLTEIPEDAFRGVGATVLYLNNNSISKIGRGAFSGFGTRTLRSGTVDLSNNNIERLSNDIFGVGWSYLVNFFIESNGLKAIERTFFRNFYDPTVTTYGLTFNARGNVCVDQNIQRSQVAPLEDALENCFANF